MEGGFALFSEDRLQICNEHFKALLPDVAPLVRPGLEYRDYLAAVAKSEFLRPERGPDDADWLPLLPDPTGRQYASFVLPLKHDRWIQVSHRKTGSGNIAVLQTEITDVVRESRREKDRLIDEHALFLQAAFDHMSLGISTFSAAGDLLVFNERFGELLGLPFSLLRKGTGVGRIADFLERTRDLNGTGDAIDLMKWVRAVRSGRAVQVRLRRRPDLTLDVRIHGLPDGGFMTTIMDVTREMEASEGLRRLNETLERRVQERTAELTETNRLLRLQYEEQARAEEALREAKETAEEANRTKTRFLAAASHDLLQPINAAKLYISTLREQPTQENVIETAARLERSFSSIETLLHALLEISRLDSRGAEFNVTDFRLDEVLGSLSGDMTALAAEKGIELRIVPSRRWVRSDPRYLRRCVQNLVANAIQYTAEGRVLVGVRVRGDKVVIEVWDTGIGISPEDQERIFDEFTRVGTSCAGSGVGLGLSIVERACRHLGHRVALRSTPGVGSMFSIELPRAAPGEVDVADPMPEPSVAEGDLDRIILVVENDPEVLDATVRKLEGWGASVLAAGSTAEALAMMRDLGSPPDIILADYQLDGDDTGLAAIEALRAEAGLDIPAVMITASRSDALLRAGEACDFAVLTKPVRLARLRALIDWKTRHLGP
ncbi:ATP-binding protein [Amaricoccus sp. B4]|uniref:hybrid sensor histidine kinase/response regulator n=1 Tax=Amaricoccus sp. B4 TaxID=3368557 RepID=UPI003713CB1C